MGGIYRREWLVLSQLKKWSVVGVTSALIVSLAGIPSVSADTAAIKTNIEFSGISKENRYIVSASANVQKVLNVKFQGKTRNILPGHTVVNAPKGKIESVLKSQKIKLGTVKVYPDVFIKTPRPQLGSEFTGAPGVSGNLDQAIQSEIAGYWPEDTYFGWQWSMWPNYDWATPNFYGINLVDALDFFEDAEVNPGNGVNIAIIDTGSTSHPDLITAGGADFTSPDVANESDDATGGFLFGWDNDPSDPGDWCGPYSSSWHGTHVHGTIGALLNNGGVTGIAPYANIVHARGLGTCGGYTSDIAAAIVWSAGYSYSGFGINDNPYPADVINMSLGGGGMCDPITQEAINMARGRGAMVVVAAGNDFMNASMFSPASCKGVMTVASSGSSGERSSFSNYDFNVDITAPGGDYCDTAFSQWYWGDYPNCFESYIENGYNLIDFNAILSTLNTGLTTPDEPGYAFYNGTSMATPHVVGVYALVKSINPDLAPEQIQAIIKKSAAGFGDIAYSDNYDYGYYGEDIYSCNLNAQLCGVGLLDAAAAVELAIATEGSAGTSIDRVDITVGGDGRWGEATVELFMPIDMELWGSLSRVEVLLDLPGAKACRVTARNINWYTDSMSCTFKKLQLNKEHRVLVTGVYGKNRGMTQEYFFTPVTLPKVPTITGVTVSPWVDEDYGMYDGIAEVSWSSVQIPALAPTHNDDPLYYVEAFSSVYQGMWNFCAGYYMTSCEIPYLIPGDKVKFRVVLMTVRGKVTSKWTKWYYVPGSMVK